MRALKHRFLDFIQVKRKKICSQCLAISRKVALIEFTQVAFSAGPGAENEFKVPCDPLKQRFLDLTQIAF